MKSIKLTQMVEYADLAGYKHKRTGDDVSAFQINQMDLGKRPPPGDRRQVNLRIILPEYRDAQGVLLGEGGSLTGWDRDWVIKRGDVWTAVDEETFSREYEAK
jgi:hypothetical protein